MLYIRVSINENYFFVKQKYGLESPTKINKNQRSSFVFALMKCSKSSIWRAKQNEGNVNTKSSLLTQITTKIIEN